MITHKKFRSLGFISTGLIHILGCYGANWMEEPSIRNFQITSGRISTFNVDELQKCIVECYNIPDCVTVGFSDVLDGCQLYNLDLTAFTENTISQSTTNFYKAVCLQDGYSQIRPLGMCLKRVSTSPETWADADNACQTEGASIMTVDSSFKGDYLQEILFHIHDSAFGFVYFIGGHWNATASSWQWIDGTPVGGNNGAYYWLTGVPDNSTGECMAIKDIGTSLGFIAIDCALNMPYLCSYDYN